MYLITVHKYTCTVHVFFWFIHLNLGYNVQITPKSIWCSFIIKNDGILENTFITEGNKLNGRNRKEGILQRDNR